MLAVEEEQVVLQAVLQELVAVQQEVQVVHALLGVLTLVVVEVVIGIVDVEE
tara:strand:+ start:503 stop:658 length:156 start_codon:yes stop_codon:yes gene_type:complete